MDKLPKGYWDDVKLAHSRFWAFKQTQPANEKLLEELGHPQSASYREIRDLYEALPFAINSGVRLWFFHQKESWSRTEVRVELWEPKLYLTDAPSGPCAEFNPVRQMQAVPGYYLTQREAAYIHKAASVGWEGAKPFLTIPVVRYQGPVSVLDELREKNAAQGGEISMVSGPLDPEGCVSIQCVSIEDWRLLRQTLESSFGPENGQLPTAEVMRSFNREDKRLANGEVRLYDGVEVYCYGETVFLPESVVKAPAQSAEFKAMCEDLALLTRRGLKHPVVAELLAQNGAVAATPA